MEKRDDQEGDVIVVEWMKTMEKVGVRLHFERKLIILGDEVIDEERKTNWEQVKTCLQKARESRRIENYKNK